MTFSKQFPSTISTNVDTIPSIPQFRIENPLKKTIFCNAVEVVCTPEFTRKGAMVIRVNNVDLYDSRKSKGFERVGKLPIALDAELERDKFVEIFIMNEVDDNLIQCTVNIFLDEFSKTLDSSLSYISDDVVNTNVSKTESVFEFRTYTGSESPLTQLINMEGYKKMIVTLAEVATYVPPNILFTFTGTDQIADGDLNTRISINGVSFNAGETVVGIVDFLVADQRLPATFFEREALNPSVWTYRLYYMGAVGNPLNFNDPNWVFVSSATGTTTLQTPSLVSARYVRVTFEFTGATPAGANNSFLNEIFDANLFGGEAQLSFDVKDPNTGIFNELIPASEFGLITQGDAFVIQIGDTNNVSETGKVYYLPSTQTDFRATLTITGTIETGVSIIKVT